MTALIKATKIIFIAKVVNYIIKDTLSKLLKDL